MNCKKSFPAEKAQFFARICLCEECYRVAERIKERGELRLKWMLSILNEAIRDALMEGRLQFATPEQANDQSNDFLTMIQELAKKSRAQQGKDASA